MKHFFLLNFFLFLKIAAADSWVLNKSHSQFLFSVKYLKYSDVEGRFKRFKGKLKLNDQQKINSLELLLISDSIYTGNNLRDGHLKRNDFLAVQNYPVISFKMDRLANDKIIGKLTIKGITKEISVKINKTPVVVDPWKKKSFFIKFQGEINRHDFKVSWNQLFGGGEMVLADTVKFYGDLQWQLSNNKTADSKHLIPDTKALKKKERKIQIPTTASSHPDSLENQKQVKPKSSEPEPFPWLVWLSYGFVWFTSITGILGFCYFLKQKSDHPLVDFVALVLILVFAMAIYELMPFKHSS